MITVSNPRPDYLISKNGKHIVDRKGAFFIDFAYVDYLNEEWRRSRRSDDELWMWSSTEDIY